MAGRFRLLIPGQIGSKEGLKQKQITFVNKIINHIEKNGDIDPAVTFQKAPFDRPVSFTRMFDKRKQEKIVEVISEIKGTMVG